MTRQPRSLAELTERTASLLCACSNPSNPGQSRSRFILAFPKGNSGVAIYFAPLNGTLATTLDNTTFASISAPDNQTGFKGQMNLSADAALDKALSESLQNIPVDRPPATVPQLAECFGSPLRID